MAHTGSRGIALPFHDHGTRKGWGVSITPQPLFTPRKDPVPIVWEAGWASELILTGAENLAPTGTPSPDRPAHSQSLYRLRYPAHYSMGTRAYVPRIKQQFGLHAGNMDQCREWEMNKYTYNYNFTHEFVCTSMCNKNLLIIMGEIYFKNAIHNLG